MKNLLLTENIKLVSHFANEVLKKFNEAEEATFEEMGKSRTYSVTMTPGKNTVSVYFSPRAGRSVDNFRLAVPFAAKRFIKFFNEMNTEIIKFSISPSQQNGEDRSVSISMNE